MEIRKSKVKLILCLFLIFYLISIQEVYSQIVLKGALRTVIEKGQTLEIKLSTPINFYFSQAGDMVAAFTTEDIPISEDFHIPKGSRLEGVVTKITKPKRFGQDGTFEIDFNEIVTPDNASIPVYASISSDISSTTEKIANILTYDSALVAYGAFHGAVASFQYGGIPLTIFSHGISILAGAGLGAGAGVVGSVVRKGKIPVLLTSLNIPVALKSNFYILGDLTELQETRNKKQEARNTMQEAGEKRYTGFRFFPRVKKEEIELQVRSVNKKHNKTYGNYIVVQFNLKNNSQKDISLSDFVLLDKENSEVLHPDLFLSGTGALKKSKPQDDTLILLAFLVSDKKKSFSLALIDPLDNEEIVRVPLKENWKLED